MKIGIPRAGLYYLYFPFWKRFFEELGIEVVVSPKTDKQIMDLGLKTANGEACLPIKIYYGHVNWLRNEGVDFFLFPYFDRVFNSAEKLGEKSFFCPYFVGMSDVMRAEYPEIETISPKMTFENGIIDPEPWLELADKLGKSKAEVKLAHEKAQEEHTLFVSRMQSEQLMPVEIIDSVKINSSSKDKIAIIGHPYLIYDFQASLNIIDKMIKNGYSIRTMEMVTEQEKEEALNSLLLQPHNHWYVTNEERMALSAVARDKEVKGIIYLTPFNCGPDFLMETYVLKDIRKFKPITTISFDEASGEAGLATRIEAFIDVLK
ncbi:MAG: acyl-CoA dehydratase activase-related protein [Patescibacteria group bacterium]|jgi:predicted nucleotide-binding protein (sugar kinase/HSP70/actin superfamily)